ncbi:hypothetical protein BCR33DRAFT_435404 [Rhizoclosmatium globosum]|uniref:G-protein coupled receptors family 1 profile domain-containing protein n=1 Tax=Rhizoclosmatium globosum TaxID=329046 RepID=A0A1Y2BU21_9FUNG|nr:hypothetical protein BCR33DRAFT_435404 [Rhizoclosmatium globosum]|eukprot:ORY38249.1 hypothetical protein BCR33DRAFT_435404 [Rhizoclosmatium globosum]
MDSLDWLFQPVFIFASAIGAIFNVLVIVTNIDKSRNLPASSFLAFWLSVFYAASTINELAIVIHNMVNDNVELISFHCKVYGLINLFCVVATILLIFGLSLIRYAIVVLRVRIQQYWVSCYVGVIMLCAVVFANVGTLCGTKVTIRPSHTFAG